MTQTQKHKKTPVSPSRAEKSDKRSRLLIVDYDQTVLELIETVLNSRYDVTGPVHGLDVVKLAESFRPDLILLDVDQRDATGSDICRALRARSALKRVPILFMTARHEEGDVLQDIRSDIDAWITKPFEAPQLLEHIESLLCS